MRSFIAATLLVMIVLALASIGYQHYYLPHEAETADAIVEHGGTAGAAGEGAAVNGNTAPDQAGLASDIITSDTVQTGVDCVVAAKEDMQAMLQSKLHADDNDNAAAISDLEKQIADMQVKIAEEDGVHRQLLKPLPQTPIFDLENAQAERDRQIRAQIERKEKIKESGLRLRELNLELQGLKKQLYDLKHLR